MKKNIILFAILGLISGYLSLYAFEDSEKYTNYLKIILRYGPGWIFGITMSVLLYFTQRKNILLHFLFIGISTFAYYIALLSFIWFEGDIGIWAFSAAGLIGSLILALGLKSIYSLPILYIIPVIIAGTVAGPIFPNLGIFPIWQTVVAIAIGYVISEAYHGKQKNN